MDNINITPPSFNMAFDATDNFFIITNLIGRWVAQHLFCWQAPTSYLLVLPPPQQLLPRVTTYVAFLKLSRLISHKPSAERCGWVVLTVPQCRTFTCRASHPGGQGFYLIKHSPGKRENPLVTRNEWTVYKKGLIYHHPSRVPSLTLDVLILFPVITFNVFPEFLLLLEIGQPQSQHSRVLIYLIINDCKVANNNSTIID